MEKPRGDKLLSDHGARRELAQALAEGVTVHLADLRRRLRGVERWIVQIDEPALASVIGGKVPTASGFGRHRRVDLPEASAHLEWVIAAIVEAGGEAWVHSCAPETPWSLVAGAGASGLSADLSMLGAADLDVFAEALEGGRTAALGVVASTDPAERAVGRAHHRAGAALARHAGTGPRGRPGAPRDHADVRTRRCRPATGPDGRSACRGRSLRTSDARPAASISRAAEVMATSCQRADPVSM